jgi:hypothetical protein
MRHLIFGFLLILVSLTAHAEIRARAYTSWAQPCPFVNPNPFGGGNSSGCWDAKYRDSSVWERDSGLSLVDQLNSPLSVKVELDKPFSVGCLNIRNMRQPILMWDHAIETKLMVDGIASTTSAMSALIWVSWEQTFNRQSEKQCYYKPGTYADCPDALHLWDMSENHNNCLVSDGKKICAQFVGWKLGSEFSEGAIRSEAVIVDEDSLNQACLYLKIVKK